MPTFGEAAPSTRNAACSHPDWDWQPIAPTPAGALEQLATHLLETHAGEGDEAFSGAPVVVHREDGVWEFAPADAVDSAEDDAK